MFIENLKRLSAKNYFVTINVDGDHVQVTGTNVEWSGNIDQLPEFLNDAAIIARKEARK